MTLAQTLQKYRGEIITVETSHSETKGSIVSVENRQDGANFIETLTLVNKDGFLSFGLTEIKRIQFENEELRKEFELAMVGLAKSRAADLKTLALMFEGQGTRKIRFSYNVDAPVWRMTYRLDLREGKSRLQGWAHIDNVTGVDWKDIELDLRSGKPQSFHVDLFAPVLAERNAMGLDIFDIPSDRALVSQWFGFDPPTRLGQAGGFGGGGGGRGFGKGSGGGGFGGGGGGFFGGSGAGSAAPGMDINSSVSSAAVSGRSARMVRFKLKEAVTIKAGRSSMVPVVMEELPTRKFSQITEYETKYGVLFAELTNNTIQPLIPGPLTCYQDGDFVGDSVLKRIEPGQTSGIAYGSDMQVRLDVKNRKENESVVAVRRLDNRNVEVEHRKEFALDCLVINSDNQSRKVQVRVAKTYDRVEPKTIRPDASHHIYELETGGGMSTPLKIVQSKSNKKPLLVKLISKKNVAEWQDKGVTIEPSLLTFLEKMHAMQLLLSQKLEKRSLFQDKERQILAEQDRLTTLIKQLGEKSELGATYVEKLAKSETDLEATRTQLKKANEDVDETQSQLDALLN